MKKNMLQILILFLVLSVLIVMNVEAAETIKLGVAGAHSGDLASYGLPTVKAAELVVKQVNSRGGVLGRQVELLVEDDVCKPEIAVNSATKLISQGAAAVLGHICSGATKATLGLYHDAKIVVMSPSATSPELTQSGQYPNFYRTIASDDEQARLEVDFAVKTLKLKKFAILHDKGDYGKGLAEYARKFIEQTPQVTVVLYEGVTPGALDYSAVVQKIRRAGADGVIYGGYHPEAALIVSQMRKKNMTTFFISGDGVKDETFLKVAGKYAEGVYASSARDVSKNPLAVVAVADHKKAYGADPGAFYLNAYAAALALLNGMEKAGGTDYAKMGKALRTSTVETPLGKIRFNEKGDAIGVGFSMYQVKKGSFTEVR